MTTITLNDCRRLKYCMKGVREYCARTKLDYDRLRTTGLEETAFAEVDDVYVSRLISVAKEREARHGG